MNYFVKSFEEDFSTKTLKGKHKVLFQRASEIINKSILKPNTVSFGRKRRLSTTILHSNYLKTYRPQGVIFKTHAEPAYVIPFDLAALIDTDKVVVHYYRIKNNLHIYYNHSLIPGFEEFFFKDLKSLVKKYPTIDLVWNAVNSFRDARGRKTLPNSKKRLMMYNEAVFEKTIRITPVALFGLNSTGRIIAKKYGLPYYSSAKSFYKSLK